MTKPYTCPDPGTGSRTHDHSRCERITLTQRVAARQTPEQCEHGYDVARHDTFTTYDDAGITACCQVPYTISNAFPGDGFAHCRCCWNGAVSRGDALAGIATHQTLEHVHRLGRPCPGCAGQLERPEGECCWNCGAPQCEGCEGEAGR